MKNSTYEESKYMEKRRAGHKDRAFNIKSAQLCQEKPDWEQTRQRHRKTGGKSLSGGSESIRNFIYIGPATANCWGVLKARGSFVYMRAWSPMLVCWGLGTGVEERKRACGLLTRGRVSLALGFHCSWEEAICSSRANVPNASVGRGRVHAPPYKLIDLVQ